MSSLAIAHSDISKPIRYNPYEFFRETYNNAENTLHANDPDLPSNEIRKKAKELILETYCEAARELASDVVPRVIAITGYAALAVSVAGLQAMPINPLLGFLAVVAPYGFIASPTGTCLIIDSAIVLHVAKREMLSNKNGNPLDPNALSELNVLASQGVYHTALRKLEDKLDQFKPKILLPVTNG